MIATLVNLLIPLLSVLLPALVRQSRPTAEEARPQPELRARLRQRVREGWGKAAGTGIVLLMLPLLAGCATCTVYVPDGEPVRLREPVKAAKVWVLGADGKPAPGVMDLPAGWYCLPDPGTEN